MLYISYQMKCSDVRCKRAVGNLNGVKANERVVKCNKVYLGEVEMEEAKWSDGLGNRVAITGRCIDHMGFADYSAVSIITFFHTLLVLFRIIVHMVVRCVYFCLIL